MGEHTLNVPMTLHKVNRDRLRERLLKKPDCKPGSIVILQGGDSHGLHCTDVDVAPFRQVGMFTRKYCTFFLENSFYCL